MNFVNNYFFSPETTNLSRENKSWNNKHVDKLFKHGITLKTGDSTYSWTVFVCKSRYQFVRDPCTNTIREYDTDLLFSKRFDLFVMKNDCVFKLLVDALDKKSNALKIKIKKKNLLAKTKTIFCRYGFRRTDDLCCNA